MGRRIVALAALAALIVSLSACACPPTKTAAPTKAAVAGGKDNAACLPAPCVRHIDCSACYRTEADRDMHRLRDDLPPGGDCSACGGTPRGACGCGR